MDGEEIKENPPAEAPVEAAAAEPAPDEAMDGAEAGADPAEPGAAEDGGAAEEAPAEDGAMEAESPMQEGDMEEAQQEVAEDYSQDERMKTMIKFIGDSLENFKEEEHWEDKHFNWLNDFLNDPKQEVVFFWNDFEDFSLKVSNVAPPKFYEATMLNP
jgi:hypothetical protein